MGTPSDFSKSVIKFKKLDDLPKGAPHTADEVMKAMAVLHKMIHMQAQKYGGKKSKLLPAGIAENSLLQQVSLCEEDLDEGISKIDHSLDAAYRTANTLMKRLEQDQKSMVLVLNLLKHLSAAIDEAHKN